MKVIKSFNLFLESIEHSKDKVVNEADISDPVLMAFEINESDAYALSRLAADIGQGAAEDFLSDYNVDIDAVKKAIQQKVMNKYELRDVIKGDASKAQIKRFMDEYIKEEGTELKKRGESIIDSINLTPESASINEGQFSWMTQDTGEQIGSERRNRITVYMYDNEGNRYKEDKYEGYGEFGGMDYYELLARMNGYSEEDLEEVKGPFKKMRQLGIDIAFDKLKTKDKGRKVLYPALVTDPRYNWKRHDFTQQPENDPNQSWYIEPEYDDYDDY